MNSSIVVTLIRPTSPSRIIPIIQQIGDITNSSPGVLFALSKAVTINHPTFVWIVHATSPPGLYPVSRSMRSIQGHARSNFSRCSHTVLFYPFFHCGRQTTQIGVVPGVARTKGGVALRVDCLRPVLLPIVGRGGEAERDDAEGDGEGGPRSRIHADC